MTDWKKLTSGSISDDALYLARAWPSESLCQISRYKKFPKRLRGLKGRHYFWMHPTDVLVGGADPTRETETRVYAVLRVDLENMMISGDLFEDIGRHNWIYSWTSEAIFTAIDPPEPNGGTWTSEGWDLLVMADVHTPRNANGAEGPQCKMAIAIRMHPDPAHAHQIEAMRVIRFSERSEDAEVIEDLSLSDNERRRLSTFRQMTLVNVIHTDGDNAEIYREIIDAAFGKKGAGLHDTLEDTGAGIFWDNDTDIRAPKVDKTKKTTELELLAPYQWTENPYRFAVLITTIVSDDRPTLLGVVPGLSGASPLHKSRFGAIVHAKRIIDDYLNYGDRGGIDKYEDHIGGLKQRLRHYYTHELGHLMNLPHPWQRDRFRDPGIPANPGAVSCMNYGSRFPLGQFMQAARTHLSGGNQTKQRALLLEDSERNMITALRKTIFSRDEQKWLRHAPFDQVSPGGRYFTETETRGLSLAAPGIGSGLVEAEWLKVSLWDTKGKKNGYQVLPSLKHADETYRYLCGDITLKVPEYFLERQFFQFTFQSPMLSLLVRSEYPDGKSPDAIRKTGIAPIVALPLNVQIETPSGAVTTYEDWLAGLIAEEAGKFETHGQFGLFFRYLPLLRKDFFDSIDPDATCFTLQALLRTDPRPSETNGSTNAAQKLYSNQIKVCFRESDADFASNLRALLEHEDLPFFLEMLTHVIPDHSIEHLMLPSKHNKNESSAIYASLAEEIKKLDVRRLPFGKELFGRMQTLLLSVSELDKYIQAGSVPQGPLEFPSARRIEDFLRFIHADPKRFKFFRQHIQPKLQLQEDI